MKFAAAITAACVGFLGLACPQLVAQAAAPSDHPTSAGVAPPAAEWTAAIDAAKQRFEPITAARLASARSSLDAALDSFDRWLSQNKASADYWKPRVGWNELTAELKRGDQARPAVISDLASRFSGSEEGFENPRFAQVRSVLNSYGSLLAAAQSPNNGRDWFDSRLKELGEHLAKYQQAWDPAEADKAGQILGQLQDTQEAPQLVAKILSDFGHQNLFAGASAAFIAKVGTTPAETLPEPKTEDFRDEILGTAIVGKTTTYRDSQTTRLVPSGDHIAMVVDAVGRVTSNTVGYHSPVTIYSTGFTPYTASMLVNFDANGFQHCMPTATACVHTTINGICVCGGRLVQHIATKRVYRSKSEAEAIASEHASARAAEKMNQTADDPADPNSPLRLSQTNYLNKTRYPLLRWGAFPQETHFSSSADRVSISALESNRYQLAAPSPPVWFTKPDVMWVSVHQSFINNMATATLAGRTISEFDSHEAYRNFMGSNKDLDQDLDDASRRRPCDVDEDAARQRKVDGQPAPAKENPAEPRPNETPEERIERQKHRLTTFAKTQPFTVAFVDQTFTIKIRTTRFSVPKKDLSVRDDDNLPENAQIELPGMDVTAVYRIENCKAGGFQAKQIQYTVEPSDEVRAEWANRIRGPTRRTALMGTSQRQAKRYFSRMLPEYMEFSGLNFDSHTTLARAGKMMPQEVAARDGWLAIGWSFAQ
jgi:hypothetical protein